MLPLELLTAVILTITACNGLIPASPQPVTAAEYSPTRRPERATEGLQPLSALTTNRESGGVGATSAMKASGVEALAGIPSEGSTPAFIRAGDPETGSRATAVRERIRFEHISLEQGLFEMTVSAILQDSLGFMWLGTFGGLNKYDGYQFSVYKHDPQDPHSLSGDVVYALYEDSAGVLWIGTRDGGLNRFDRATETFTRYQHNPDDPHSLSDNRVYSVLEDASGTLWVGTRNGLNRFVPYQEAGFFVRYHHRPDDPHSLSDNLVYSIYEDSRGALWIGTGNGLNKLVPSAVLRQAQDDGSGQALSGVEGADPASEEGTFTRYQHRPGEPGSLSNNAVRSIGEDASGALWVGTEDGLNRLDRATETFTRYYHQAGDPDSLGHNVVHWLYKDAGGALWIGTWGGGLDRFDPASKGGAFTHYRHQPGEPGSLSHDIVLSIYQDTGGAVWIGTPDGINHFDPTREKFRSYQSDATNPNSLSGNAINAMCEDSAGGLWIGTEGGGLNYLEQATGQYTHYQHDPEDPASLSSNGVWSLHWDSREALWVGTDNGLNRFEPGTDPTRGESTFTRYQHNPDDPHSLDDNRITRILEDRSGALWVGTYTGLNRLDLDSEGSAFTRYQHRPEDASSLSDHIVVSIYKDSSGALWVGTWGGGLNRFEPATETFVHYQHQPEDPHSLSDDNVFAIYEDSSGALWLGTMRGLNRFDRRSEQFRVYREPDGLSSDIVLGILEEVPPDGGGYLWLSTIKGLSRFDPKTETFRNYDAGDGLLAGSEFNLGACYQSRSGEMFFGGVKGLTAFYPEEVRDNAYIPPIVVTDFKLFNQPVPIGTASGGSANGPFRLKQHINLTTDLVLSYDDYVFSFEYAALNFTLPEKNQYAYMMEGVDKDWVYVGNRRLATYTTLPPGRYVFRVKGSNNDGVWNETGTSIRITVTPPWWRTWWAYSLYVLVAIGAVTGYVRYRTLAQARTVARLEAEVAERTAALQQLNQELEGRVAERTQHLRRLAARLAETEEAERRGLARELHDQVGQHLTGLGLHLRMVQRQMPACVDSSQPAAAGELYTHLDEAVALVKQVTRRIRNVMDELRPPVLEEYGLLAALRWYGERFAAQTNILVSMPEGDLSPRLPASIEMALLRVAQEALTNVARHAQAGQVTVKVEIDQGSVRMVVADDGVGFDPQHQAAPGERQSWGLQIMAERAEAVGGRCRVESLPGEGTKVIVEILGTWTNADER